MATLSFADGADIESGREHFWKRSKGWHSPVSGERWWEIFVVFANGWNGAGGAHITEIWRWNGSSEVHHRQPRNLSYQQTLDLIAEIQQGRAEAEAAASESEARAAAEAEGLAAFEAGRQP